MAESRPVLYVVRHGQTTLNAEGRFRGPTDAPLDEQGHQDAEDAKEFFKGIKLGAAYTSSKTRAMDTAEHILDPKGMAASPSDSLHAWNVGYLAGEVKKQHKDDIEFYQRNNNTPIPGGESLDEFRARVRPTILQAIHRGVRDGVPSIIVAHSSVVHEVGNIIHGNHLAALVRPGGITRVDFDGHAFSARPVYKPLELSENEKYAG